MTTFAEVARRMPPNFYLKIGVEKSEEDGHRYLCASIMEVPPEDGWTIQTYFNDPPGTKRAHDEKWLEPHRYEDTVRVAVTADVDDPAAFERLLIGMITRQWPVDKSIAYCTLCNVELELRTDLKDGDIPLCYGCDRKTDPHPAKD